MLRQDVREAAAREEFFIYPVDEIDQGIELLTGIPAGKADENGKYPPETINGKVQARLEKLTGKSIGTREDEGEDGS
jgi:predicted ATP-dependent protease